MTFILVFCTLCSGQINFKNWSSSNFEFPIPGINFSLHFKINYEVTISNHVFRGKLY